MYMKYIPIYIIDIYIFQIFQYIFQVVTDHKKKSLVSILHKDGRLSDVPMGCRCADVQK